MKMQKQRRHLQRAIQLIEQQSKTNQSFGRSFGGNVDEMDITPRTVFRVRDSEIDSAGNSMFILEDAQSRLYRAKINDTFVDSQIRGVLRVTSCNEDTFTARDATGSTFVFTPLSLLSQAEKMAAEQTPAAVTWTELQDAARAHSQRVPQAPRGHIGTIGAQQQQRMQQTRQNTLDALRGSRSVQEIEAQGPPYSSDLRNLVQRYDRGEVTRPQLTAGINAIHQRATQSLIRSQQQARNARQTQQLVVRQQAPPAQSRHPRPKILDQASDDRYLARKIQEYEKMPYSTQPFAIPLEFQDPTTNIDITGGWPIDMDAGPIPPETVERKRRYDEARDKKQGV